MRVFGILTLALMLMGATGSARANLVADPGFESCTAGGVPPDWSASAVYTNCDLNPHSGTYDEIFSGPVTLSQSILTTAGENYDFILLAERYRGQREHFQRVVRQRVVRQCVVRQRVIRQ
jgi:hypothetical protein